MKEKKKNIAENSKHSPDSKKNKIKACTDKNCPQHGSLSVRGRAFQGIVIKKFPRRVVIEFERVIYVRKYERYLKKKTKLHARLPDCMQDQINIGDLIQIKECRPISKIIHFVAIKKIKDKSK